LTKFDAVDWKIFIPNFIGIILALIQGYIWNYYYQLYKNDYDFNNFKNEKMAKFKDNELENSNYDFQKEKF